MDRDDFLASPLYGTPRGDYFDNLERFSFFCSTILPACQTLDFHPDLIHCHDWQSALVPVYLENRWAGKNPRRTKTLFTIHNLAYQGLFTKRNPCWAWNCPCSASTAWNITTRSTSSKAASSPGHHHRSPRYSQEIQTAEFGWGCKGCSATAPPPFTAFSTAWTTRTGARRTTTCFPPSSARRNSWARPRTRRP